MAMVVQETRCYHQQCCMAKCSDILETWLCRSLVGRRIYDEHLSTSWLFCFVYFCVLKKCQTKIIKYCRTRICVYLSSWDIHNTQTIVQTNWLSALGTSNAVIHADNDFRKTATATSMLTRRTWNKVVEMGHDSTAVETLVHASTGRYTTGYRIPDVIRGHTSHVPVRSPANHPIIRIDVNVKRRRTLTHWLESKWVVERVLSITMGVRLISVGTLAST